MPIEKIAGKDLPAKSYITENVTAWSQTTDNPLMFILTYWFL